MRDWPPELRLPEDHPAHPAAPLTETAYAYSNSSPGCSLQNLELYRGKPQPNPAWLEEDLAKLRGTPSPASLPTIYREEMRPCARCGEEVLHIDRLRGDELLQRSLCECGLPFELRVKGREIRQAAEERRRREEAEAEENRRQAALRKHLLQLAQECAAQHLRLHNRCVDNRQAFEECRLCKLRTVKATKNREKEQKRYEPHP